MSKSVQNDQINDFSDANTWHIQKFLGYDYGWPNALPISAQGGDWISQVTDDTPSCNENIGKPRQGLIPLEPSSCCISSLENRILHARAVLKLRSSMTTWNHPGLWVWKCKKTIKWSKKCITKITKSLAPVKFEWINISKHINKEIKAHTQIDR